VHEVGEELFYVVTDVAKALAVAHTRTAADGTPLGIVHRDVTPANVLVSREGLVKEALRLRHPADGERRAHPHRRAAREDPYRRLAELAAGNLLVPDYDLTSMDVSGTLERA